MADKIASSIAMAERDLQVLSSLEPVRIRSRRPQPAAPTAIRSVLPTTAGIQTPALHPLQYQPPSIAALHSLLRSVESHSQTVLPPPPPPPPAPFSPPHTNSAVQFAPTPTTAIAVPPPPAESPTDSILVSPTAYPMATHRRSGFGTGDYTAAASAFGDSNRRARSPSPQPNAAPPKPHPHPHADAPPPPPPIDPSISERAKYRAGSVPSSASSVGSSARRSSSASRSAANSAANSVANSARIELTSMSSGRSRSSVPSSPQLRSHSSDRTSRSGSFSSFTSGATLMPESTALVATANAETKSRPVMGAVRKPLTMSVAAFEHTHESGRAITLSRERNQYTRVVKPLPKNRVIPHVVVGTAPIENTHNRVLKHTHALGIEKQKNGVDVNALLENLSNARANSPPRRTTSGVTTVGAAVTAALLNSNSPSAKSRSSPERQPQTQTVIPSASVATAAAPPSQTDRKHAATHESFTGTNRTAATGIGIGSAGTGVDMNPSFALSNIDPAGSGRVSPTQTRTAPHAHTTEPPLFTIPNYQFPPSLVAPQSVRSGVGAATDQLWRALALAAVAIHQQQQVQQQLFTTIGSNGTANTSTAAPLIPTSTLETTAIPSVATPLPQTAAADISAPSAALRHSTDPKAVVRLTAPPALGGSASNSARGGAPPQQITTISPDAVQLQADEQFAALSEWQRAQTAVKPPTPTAIATGVVSHTGAVPISISDSASGAGSGSVPLIQRSRPQTPARSGGSSHRSAAGAAPSTVAVNAGSSDQAISVNPNSSGSASLPALLTRNDIPPLALPVTTPTPIASAAPFVPPVPPSAGAESSISIYSARLSTAHPSTVSLAQAITAMTGPASELAVNATSSDVTVPLPAVASSTHTVVIGAPAITVAPPHPIAADTTDTARLASLERLAVACADARTAAVKKPLTAVLFGAWLARTLQLRLRRLKNVMCRRFYCRRQYARVFFRWRQWTAREQHMNRSVQGGDSNDSSHRVALSKYGASPVRVDGEPEPGHASTGSGASGAGLTFFISDRTRALAQVSRAEVRRVNGKVDVLTARVNRWNSKFPFHSRERAGLPVSPQLAPSAVVTAHSSPVQQPLSSPAIEHTNELAAAPPPLMTETQLRQFLEPVSSVEPSRIESTSAVSAVSAASPDANSGVTRSPLPAPVVSKESATSHAADPSDPSDATKQRLLALCGGLIQRYAQRSLHRAFGVWHLKSQLERKQQTRSETHHRTSLQRRMFAGWLTQVVRSRVAIEKLRGIQSQMNEHLIRAGFADWRMLTRRRITARAKAAAEFRSLSSFATSALPAASIAAPLSLSLSDRPKAAAGGGVGPMGVDDSRAPTSVDRRAAYSLANEYHQITTKKTALQNWMSATSTNTDASALTTQPPPKGFVPPRIDPKPKRGRVPTGAATGTNQNTSRLVVAVSSDSTAAKAARVATKRAAKQPAKVTIGKRASVKPKLSTGQFRPGTANPKRDPLSESEARHPRSPLKDAVHNRIRNELKATTHHAATTKPASKVSVTAKENAPPPAIVASAVIVPRPSTPDRKQPNTTTRSEGLIAADGAVVSPSKLPVRTASDKAVLIAQIALSESTAAKEMADASDAEASALHDWKMEKLREFAAMTAEWRQQRKQHSSPAGAQTDRPARSRSKSPAATAVTSRPATPKRRDSFSLGKSSGSAGPVTTTLSQPMTREQFERTEWDVWKQKIEADLRLAAGVKPIPSAAAAGGGTSITPALKSTPAQPALASSTPSSSNVTSTEQKVAPISPTRSNHLELGLPAAAIPPLIGVPLRGTSRGTSPVRAADSDSLDVSIPLAHRISPVAVRKPESVAPPTATASATSGVSRLRIGSSTDSKHRQSRPLTRPIDQPLTTSKLPTRKPKPVVSAVVAVANASGSGAGPNQSSYLAISQKNQRLRNELSFDDADFELHQPGSTTTTITTTTSTTVAGAGAGEDDIASGLRPAHELAAENAERLRRLVLKQKQHLAHTAMLQRAEQAHTLTTVAAAASAGTGTSTGTGTGTGTTGTASSIASPNDRERAWSVLQSYIDSSVATPSVSTAGPVSSALASSAVASGTASQSASQSGLFSPGTGVSQLEALTAMDVSALATTTPARSTVAAASPLSAENTTAIGEAPTVASPSLAAPLAPTAPTAPTPFSPGSIATLSSLLVVSPAPAPAPSDPLSAPSPAPAPALAHASQQHHLPPLSTAHRGSISRGANGATDLLAPMRELAAIRAAGQHS